MRSVCGIADLPYHVLLHDMSRELKMASSNLVQPGEVVDFDFKKGQVAIVARQEKEQI